MLARRGRVKVNIGAGRNGSANAWLRTIADTQMVLLNVDDRSMFTGRTSFANDWRR